MNQTVLRPEVTTWLTSTLGGSHWSIETVTPDMGQRVYYRIIQKSASPTILCLYPTSIEKNHPWIEVDLFLRKHKFHVPEILASNFSQGAVLIEDLGNQALSHLQPDQHFDPTVSILVQLDKIGLDNIPKNSCILNNFLDYSLFQRELKNTTQKLLANRLGFPEKSQHEFQSVMSKLLLNINDYPKTICHRDYHVNNIFLHNQNYYLIDFQDMRVGFGGYDLFSLLFERESIATMSPKIFEARKPWIKTYWTNSRYSKSLTWDAFYIGFLLHGIQRCLKALGNFADRKSFYGKYIPPSLMTLDILIVELSSADKTMLQTKHFFDQLALSAHRNQLRE